VGKGEGFYLPACHKPTVSSHLEIATRQLMTTEQILQTILELIGFLTISYFIFYKKYVEELGKQMAELTVIKQKTLDIENVKKTFNQELEIFKKNIQLDISKEIEPLRATLSRENIAYQIYNTEFIKLRFQRLDDLYGKLYELYKYCHLNLSFYADEPDFRGKRDKFHEHYKRAEDTLYRASIYIDDNVRVSVIDVLNESFRAMQAFNSFYHSDPARNKFIFEQNRSQQLQTMIERNNNSLDKLTNCIDNMPTLLKTVETEFRKHLTIELS
jgi:hypothetical protein